MSELVLEGVLCQGCGSYIDGEETGYPRDCESCVVVERTPSEIKTYYGGTNPLD